MAVQSANLLLRNESMIRSAGRKYGPIFRIKLLGFPAFIVIADPSLIKQTFTEKSDVLHAGSGSPLRAVLGDNSLAVIDEDAHLRQRRLLLPPFHGERMKSYSKEFAQIADEVMDGWPAGSPMRTLEPMQTITSRAILQTILGARGDSLRRLEVLMPQFVTVAQRVAMLRIAQTNLGRYSPWGRFLKVRAAIDSLIYPLIETARDDSDLPDRSDVLALLVQATDEDGSSLSDAAIRDHLLTMLLAGHETTAGALAWAIERLSRNPGVLGRLEESIRSVDDGYVNAVFDETLRCRPAVAGVARTVEVDQYELGGYSLPRGTYIAASSTLAHYDPELFTDPWAFRPERFLENRPSNYAYFPFGGGVRRCIGAAFAQMEFVAVMKRLFDRFDIEISNARDERWHFRGVTFAPGNGGIATFTPR